MTSQHHPFWTLLLADRTAPQRVVTSAHEHAVAVGDPQLMVRTCRTFASTSTVKWDQIEEHWRASTDRQQWADTITSLVAYGRLDPYPPTDTLVVAVSDALVPHQPKTLNTQGAQRHTRRLKVDHDHPVTSAAALTRLAVELQRYVPEAHAKLETRLVAAASSLSDPRRCDLAASRAEIVDALEYGDVLDETVHPPPLEVPDDPSPRELELARLLLEKGDLAGYGRWLRRNSPATVVELVGRYPSALGSALTAAAAYLTAGERQAAEAVTAGIAELVDVSDLMALCSFAGAATSAASGRGVRPHQLAAWVDLTCAGEALPHLAQLCSDPTASWWAEMPGATAVRAATILAARTGDTAATPTGL